MTRPWNTLPIIESGEPLEQIPSSINCLLPHPYFLLGAPYSDASDPWRLRAGVVSRLLIAQANLKKERSTFKLALFDGWRPISVQEFMVEYAINQACLSRGLDRNQTKHAQEVKKVIEEVGCFWSPPSRDSTAPPPHSTGGAVDITLIEASGNLVDMGSEIDAIGPISSPNYYLEEAKANKNSDSYIWHNRRELLSKVMIQVGFAQHPKEWWHFSYGDQMWAWLRGYSKAIYGCCDSCESNLTTS